MCFVWRMKADDLDPMESFTELVDALVDGAEVTDDRIRWILEQGSFNINNSQDVKFTTSQLQCILATARLISRSKQFQHTQYRNLSGLVPKFLEALPLCCSQESFPEGFTFKAASLYFANLISYLVSILESSQTDNAAFSSAISTAIGKIVTSHGANSNRELPPPIKAFFVALSNSCPSLDAPDVDKISFRLFQEWILPLHGLSQDNGLHKFTVEEASVQRPSKGCLQNTFNGILDHTGKLESPISKHRSPSKPSMAHERNSPIKAETEEQNGFSILSMNGNAANRGIPDHSASPQQLDVIKTQHLIALQEEDYHRLEKQGFAFRILAAVDAVGLNCVGNHNLSDQLTTSAVQHLKAIPSILKLRKRDWPVEEDILKPRIHVKLQICKAASIIYQKSINLEGRMLKHVVREMIAILMDIVDACTISPWRRLRTCEDLFASVLQNVADTISLCSSQDVKAFLLRFRKLIMATCAQADHQSSNTGPMFESIVKTTCQLFNAIWDSETAALKSFLLSLVANVRNGSEQVQEEEGKLVFPNLCLNLIRFLTDTVLIVCKIEAVELICPIFVESLEGVASAPSRLRLQLLDSVARIATLGFEKSYREAVTLLTRSYIEKLSTVGSTQSRTLAREATEERVETLPKAFSTIASGLSQPKLRSDYRQRLLQLCSDVGLAAESKSDKSGSDLLGPLLAPVAEICSDFDVKGPVEPTQLKLFRNLWFYIVIFALVPSTQNVQVVATNVSSSDPSLSNTSAGTSDAFIRGTDKSEWHAAVIRIAQGTPPLVSNPLKWMEDELELNELYNPGSRRGSNNEKAASTQRAALCAALKDYIDATSINTMSGVKATYFRAVAFLEILRMNHNGGLIKCNTKDSWESALCCVFEYLEKPNLAPSIYQCFVAIVRRSFDAAMAWLERLNGSEAERKETVIVIHTCFLISKMAHRSENVRDLACGLLDQIKHQYPQVLWSPCFNDLLHLLQIYSSLSLDPTKVSSVQSLIKKQIRNWIIKSLLLAPCTTQGLLQEWIRSLSTLSSGSYFNDMHELLSDIKLDTGRSVIPALFAASAAAAGTRGCITDMGTVGVISNCIFSANMKSSYILMNIRSLTLGLQDSTDETLFGTLNSHHFIDEKSENAATLKHDLKHRLISKFVQLLQQYISQVEQGEPVKSEAFRNTCLKSTAFIVSELGHSKNLQMDGLLKLLRLLCWCPAYICSCESLSTGIFIWTWLVSAAPYLSTILLAELVDAWLWTIETGRGLFASGPTTSGPHGKLRPHLVAGEPVSCEGEDVVEGIIAHRLWLGFFFDRFEVAKHNSPDQLSLFGRMLQGSLRRPQLFSCHPAATGTFFSLMLLGLKFCSSQIKVDSVSLPLLEDHIYRCALAWFSTNPEWYDGNSEGFLKEETQSVSLFNQQLSLDLSHAEDLLNKGEGTSNNFSSQLDLAHPVWGKRDDHAVAKEKCRQLLQMLCHHELERLEIWANPLRDSSPSRLRGMNSERWIEFVRTAWSIDPRIALALASRFPAIGSLRSEITSLVQAHVTDMFDFPEALPYIVTPKAAEDNSPVLQLLPHWAPCSITKALEFLSPNYKGNPRIMAYVLRVLESYPPDCVKFFMPQLVQTLRYDYRALVEGYLLTAAQRSYLFAHLLIWQLQGEEPISLEDLSKEQLQEEKEFHKIVLRVKNQIIESFNADAYDIYEREFRFFDSVTNVSGVLFKVAKEERRARIKRELEKIEVEGQDLYLPTAPSMLVRGIQLDSGIPLQSAAKVPIMVTFDVVESKEPHVLKPQACMFKVGDDCRQDVLALQVISLLRDIFKAVGLNLYLFPYGVLPTGPGKGIIEVVPNARSRSQMGETNDGGLFEIFVQDFGPVGSSKFEAARDNFLVSSAGYAVASLLLQPKDRHNGNLLFDNEGRLVHIDFGFILETSPGGNLRFESAQFKLSHEMTQLLDPSGVMKSETWNRFLKLCIRGYLAARQHMDAIINTVLLMVDSGLPCFSRGDPIGNLRKRFHPEMTEREAANFMIKTCEDAYNKWTTAGYDLIQYLQQGIEK